MVEVALLRFELCYMQEKTDSFDAKGAVRSVLSRQAGAHEEPQTGSSEMIRHLKIARNTAVKSRSQEMVTLEALIINTSAELRDWSAQLRK